MSTTISPARPPHDAPHDAVSPSGADSTDPSGAPPTGRRPRRGAGLLGRRRWLAALIVIAVLAGLAGLGAALQGAGSDQASTSDSSAGLPPATSPGSAGGTELSEEANRSATTGFSGDAVGASPEAAASPDAAADVVEPGVPVGPVETPQVTGVDRDLVRTATLDLTAKEPDTAAAKARSLVGALGGRIAQEQTSFSGKSSVVLTLAIPPKNFDAAMEQLSELGKVTNRSVSTDDVTGTVTDLEGRITTLKASITRLQGFLADASDAGQIGMLESELLRRETELEGIQGQLRTIEAQVAESTVTLTITETGKRLDPVIEEDDGVGFMDGLTSGWSAFTAVVNAIVVAMAAIAPFLAIGLIVWLVVRLVRRRRSAGASATDTASSKT